MKGFIAYLFIVVAILLGCGLAYAQVGTAVTLLNVTNVTATQTGSAFRFPGKADHFVARVTATEDSGTATYAVRVDHSPDCTVWSTLLNFSTLSATSGEDVHVNALNTTVFPCLRAVATVTGSGQWDLKVAFYGDSK